MSDVEWGFISPETGDFIGVTEEGMRQRWTAVLDTERLLDRIRDETREAVLEGDAQDCLSADCIADAVYEIVRVALRDAVQAKGDAEMSE